MLPMYLRVDLFVQGVDYRTFLRQLWCGQVDDGGIVKGLVRPKRVQLRRRGLIVGSVIYQNDVGFAGQGICMVSASMHTMCLLYAYLGQEVRD